MFNVKVSRRQFLKWLTASAAALGLSQSDLLKLNEALAAGPPPVWNMPAGSLLRVIWVAGAACSGCPTSLLNYLANPNDQDVVLQAVATNGASVGLPPLIPIADIDALYPLGGDGDLDIAEVVLEVVTIEYSQIIMAASGDVSNNYLLQLIQDNVPFVLLLEGTIQTAANGKYCRVMDVPGHIAGVGNSWSDYMEEYVTTEATNGLPLGQPRTDVTMAGASLWLADRANCLAVVAFGTCAAFGGVPAAKGSVTGGKSAWEWLNGINGLNKLVANVPGCPPHPDWFIATVAAAILELDNVIPGNHMLTANLDTSLDHLGRPKNVFKGVGASMFSSDRIFCNDCPRLNSPLRPTTINACQKKAGAPDGQCMLAAGCNGYLNFAANIRADCPTRKWNSFEDHSKNNWCVGNNMPCQGCTDPGFPDKTSPFYKKTKGF